MEGGALGAVSPKKVYLREDTAHVHTAPTAPCSSHVAFGAQHTQAPTVDNRGAQDVRDAHVPMASMTEGGDGRAGKQILKSPLVDGFTCYIASIVQDMQDPQVFVGEQGAAQILKMQSYSDFVY